MKNYYIKVTNTCNVVKELIELINNLEFDFILYGKLPLTIDLSDYSNAKPPVLVTLSSFINKVINYDLCSGLTIVPPANNDVRNYMARMKFFKVNPYHHFEYPYTEYDATGRFIELKSFDTENQHVINQELTDIIQRINCPEDLKMLVSYCFSELTDNTCCHAETTDSGFICGQTYASSIHISIADSGIGIAGSMRASHEYASLNDCELLSKSIEESVSSKFWDRTRDHQGMGLFALSEFIRKSAGELHIYSNRGHLCINGDRTILEEIPNWEGTLIDFKYPLNYNVTMWAKIVNDFFVEKGYTVPEHFLKNVDDLF